MTENSETSQLILERTGSHNIYLDRVNDRGNIGLNESKFGSLVVGLQSFFIVVVVIMLPNLTYNLGRRQILSHLLSHKEEKQGNGNVAGEDRTKNFRGLDIYVIGFAKTGTGSLRELFIQSEEIAMLGTENKDLCDGSAVHALAELEDDFDGMPNSTNVQRAIKTPGAILNVEGIKRLAKYTTSNTKLIIGLRHPVKWFQSYYNYRVRKIVQGKKKCRTDPCIPSPESLIGGREKSWKYVYTGKTRFDLYMKQLAKVDLSSSELLEMTRNELQLAPNRFKVFIYDVDQMSDTNEERAAQFRADFQEYLGLKKPIVSWPQDKVFHEPQLEEIDICDSEHDRLRQVLVSNGKIAAAWLRDKFIGSHDVVIGGKDFFLDLIHSWGTDICKSTYTLP